MKKAAKSHQRPALREMPFAQLLTAVPELADARREYAGKPSADRRAAAEWAYDSGMASDLFSRAVLAAGGGADGDAGFDSGVVALAIDPLFAPGLLTVGSLEYQHKRPGAAMAMFLTLTTLPPGEPDLDEIIDKAGCFLLDQNDPRVLNDLGWTLVLAGFHDEARTVLERAATLAPADYELPRNNLREPDNRMRRTRRSRERQT